MDDFSPGGLTSRRKEIKLDNWDFLVEVTLSGSVSFLQLRKHFEISGSQTRSTKLRTV